MSNTTPAPAPRIGINTRVEDLFRHPLTMDVLNSAVDREVMLSLLTYKALDVDATWELYRDFKTLEKVVNQLTGYLREQIMTREANEEFDHEYSGPLVSGRVETRAGRATIDKAKLLEDMGEEFVSKYTKVGQPFKQVSFKDIG